MQAVLIFEDELWANFLPLTYTHPVWDLRCGTSALWQKVVRALPPGIEVHLQCRSYLAPTVRHCVKGVFINEFERLEGKSILFVNARLLVTPELAGQASVIEPNTAYVRGRELLAAYLEASSAEKILPHLSEPLGEAAFRAITDAASRQQEVLQVPLLSYPWELINQNAQLINSEFTLIAKGEGEGRLEQGAFICGGDSRHVYVGRGSVIHPTVVLDVSGGPIYIGENTIVFPPTRIEGPTYIGSGTQILGGKIREGCHIGDVCRIGGEVEESIFHGYSNKYHDGFIGHAYVGEWVNLGALTTNSDLKDTYGDVRMEIGGQRVSAGTKVGCFIADHVKTSIGTLIYTGKRIGVASHVHGAATEDVPSFTIWAKSIGGRGDAVELLFDSVVETHRRVLARRKARQTPEEVELLRHLFELTKEERQKAGVREGRPKF